MKNKNLTLIKFGFLAALACPALGPRLPLTTTSGSAPASWA